MSTLQRNAVAGGILVFVIAIGLWIWAGSAQAPDVPASLEVATTTPSATDADSGSVTSQGVLVQGTGTDVAVKSAIEAQSTAALSVDGVPYALTAPAGSTLKDAMDRLQNESGFTYAYKNYAGLGSFVTTINGRASTGDFVWILYVDGEKSSTGISSTRIRSGDVIEWKLEKSY
jgi:hypothetical protein